MNRTDILNLLAWAGIGFLVVNTIEWMFPDVNSGVVPAFFFGAFVAFAGLTAYGVVLSKKHKQMKDNAMQQFMVDQKADNEQQAKMDKEMVKHLQDQHELSGTEQDKRLKALEAALKHLRKQ